MVKIQEHTYTAQRCFPYVLRKIRKNKLEYPLLYAKVLTTTKKDRRYCTFMRFNAAEAIEYKRFVQNVLVLRKYPATSEPLRVMSHNGGRYTGFYENGTWYYRSSGDVIIDTNIVVLYEPHHLLGGTL